MFNCKSVVVLCLLVSYGSALKLPQTFPRCKVSAALDNKNNECLVNAIQVSIDQLADKGNADIGAVDLDPMKISKILIEQGENRPIAIKLEYTDNDITGLSNLKIKSVNGKLSSPKDFKIKMVGSSELLTLTGPYKVNGKVLVLPIQGDGLSNMTMENVQSEITIKGEPQTKNGKEYLKITDFQMTLSTTRLYISMGNLFNGDKALGDNMNKFLNENWQDIFGELKSAIEDAFSAIFMEYTKRIMERIPFKNIFLIE